MLTTRAGRVTLCFRLFLFWTVSFGSAWWSYCPLADSFSPSSWETALKRYERSQDTCEFFGWDIQVVRYTSWYKITANHEKTRTDQDGYTLNSSVSHQTCPPLSGKDLKPIILRAYALRTPGPGKKKHFLPPVWRQSCLVLNWSLFRLCYSSEDGWLLLLCVQYP